MLFDFKTDPDNTTERKLASHSPRRANTDISQGTVA